MTIANEQTDANKLAKQGKITEENIAESRRLLSIWGRMKPTLTAKGYGTQEAFGHQFGIGNQSAVGHFLNGRAAISPKAAAAFAAGLECKISDFSPRVAKMLHETNAAPLSHTPPPAQAPAPVSLIARAKSQDAPGVIATLTDLAAMLQLVPVVLRDSIARELALLANAPDSAATLTRLGEALSSFGAMPGRRHADQTAGSRNRTRSLAHRMELIDDSANRDRIYALVESLIDRELRATDPSPPDTDDAPAGHLSMPVRSRVP